jgi:hypothetical protein
MNFIGHFKNSRFHSIQNCDFKMCVCHWHTKTLRILRLLYSRGEDDHLLCVAFENKKLKTTTAVWSQSYAQATDLSGRDLKGGHCC